MPTVAGERKRFRSRVVRYGPLIAWLAFIFYASSAEFSANNTSLVIGPLLRWIFPGISDHSLATVHLITRKAAHFSEYGVLAVLAARGFSSSSKHLLSTAWFRWSLLLVVACAVLDEFHQSFVPSRSASLYDSLMDIAGGLTLLVIYKIWKHRRQNRAN